MDLILIVGPQAVGKMTVGKALEKRIDAKLLFNHETLDIFARFLGFTKETFRLSDWMRKELFKAFVENKDTNQTKGIIFTVVVDFSLKKDYDYLQEIISLFTDHGGNAYFVELETELDERLVRNKSKERLEAKPSKRNVEISENELLTSMQHHRLNSFNNEVENILEGIRYFRVNNTNLSPTTVANQIDEWIKKGNE